MEKARRAAKYSAWRRAQESNAAFACCEYRTRLTTALSCADIATKHLDHAAESHSGAGCTVAIIDEIYREFGL